MNIDINSKIGRVVVRTLLLTFAWLGFVLYVHLNYKAPFWMFWIGFPLVIVTHVVGMIRAGPN